MYVEASGPTSFTFSRSAVEICAIDGGCQLEICGFNLGTYTLSGTAVFDDGTPDKAIDGVDNVTLTSTAAAQVDVQMELDHSGALQKAGDPSSALSFTSGFVPAAELAGLALGSAMSSFAVLKSVAAIAAEIYSLYRCVKANHQLCRRLGERAMSLQSALARFAATLHEASSRTQQLEEEDYHSLNTQLIRVLQSMERAHDLIQAWGGAKHTFFGKLKRALISRHFHEEFLECNQQLSDCLADLRGDAILQMFTKQISLPDPSTWPAENQEDSHADLQMMPSAIASIAKSQTELASSLAAVHLSVQEMKSGLEAQGVTAASLEKGFMHMEMKLDHIEGKLDQYNINVSQNFDDMQMQMKKIEELLRTNSDVGKKAPRKTSSKRRFLQEKMPHLAIPYADLRILQEVGSGGFGTVYWGTWQGNEVAYKEIVIESNNERASKRQILELYKEAYIMSLLRTPLVCGLYGVTLEAPHYGLVLPYYSGGALDDFLRDTQVQMTEDMCLHMALNMATAMAHLHSCSPPIIHGDLKSRNVLLEVPWKPGVQPKLVLCDFGLSTVKMDVQSTVGGSTLASMATQKHGGGTLNWKAPELFEQEADVTKQSDVYAFAMVMYELAARKYPFQGLPDIRVLQLVVDKQERPKMPTSVLQPYAELMKECWAQDPIKRPSFSEVEKRLRQMIDVYYSSSMLSADDIPQFDPAFKSRKVIDWYDSAKSTTHSSPTRTGKDLFII
ncbi:hypothetical protein CYMTET_43545 [Cymbomonas tetramitiformis]|uniref:Protein kinase domain-containing protein n=1 Tax=Cymbomonas tetramitiformis TaxID=36881 RepID=A0AAE0C1Y3_9CHLO|nr:hypothetical protein CYMTET_43545 [Cymbomonas tetramitiformis]